MSSRIIQSITYDYKFSENKQTKLHLDYSEGSIICEKFDIISGTFQCDSLSPLLFCMALTLLSYELNDTGYGYKIEEEKINDLFYMDDLKLYGKNDKELDGPIDIQEQQKEMECNMTK